MFVYAFNGLSLKQTMFLLIVILVMTSVGGGVIWSLLYLFGQWVGEPFLSNHKELAFFAAGLMAGTLVSLEGIQVYNHIHRRRSAK